MELNGQTYRFNRLPAMAQFHLMRKLAPAIATIGISPELLKSVMAGNVEAALGVLPPLADYLAKLSFEDSEFIMATCLSSAERQEGEHWARVWAKGGGLVYQDLNPFDLVRLVVECLKENFGGFFGKPAGASSTRAG
jgi:hypothetical protein